MLESVTFPQPDNTPAADSSFSAPAPKRARKIAILGFGETVKDCPWQDPSWELWAMNGFWRAAEADYGVKAPEDRYSLWFDMHTVEYTRAYGQAAGFGDKQERWLEKEHPFPILMLDEDPAFPSVIRFPIEQLVETVGRDYFTSTVAYALAFALSQADVAEVALFGIDLVHKTEYAEQRPCAEYWIARLEGAGVKVTTHAESALLRTRYRYGYSSEEPLLVQMRSALRTEAANLQKSLEKNQAEAERAHGQTVCDSGALQMVQAMLDRLDSYARGGKV